MGSTKSEPRPRTVVEFNQAVGILLKQMHTVLDAIERGVVYEDPEKEAEDRIYIGQISIAAKAFLVMREVWRRCSLRYEGDPDQGDPPWGEPGCECPPPPPEPQPNKTSRRK